MTTEQTDTAHAGAAGAMAPYLKLAQRQLEANLAIAATWAAAMSAISGGLLSPVRSDVIGDQAEKGTPELAADTPRTSGPIGDAASERLTASYWTNSGTPNPSWPRWLNEPPTVQPDLFDEAIELLVDDDIKTAS
ncbi:MAG: hypothetical protein ABJD68_01000 [Nakamurella sp.]